MHDVDIGVPQRLCHLPLVMDVMRRTGLPNIIDAAVRDDRRCVNEPEPLRS